MNKDCYIGFWQDYDNTEIITYNDLKTLSIDSAYSMYDFCDKRKSTCLKRFNFCPMCGKEIKWNELLKLNK